MLSMPRVRAALILFSFLMLIGSSRANQQYTCEGMPEAGWAKTEGGDYRFEYKSETGSDCVAYRFRNLPGSTETRINWRLVNADSFLVNSFLLDRCASHQLCEARTPEFLTKIPSAEPTVTELTFGGLLGKDYARRVIADVAAIYFASPGSIPTDTSWSRITGDFGTLEATSIYVDLVLTSVDRTHESGVIEYSLSLEGDSPAQIVVALDEQLESTATIGIWSDLFLINSVLHAVTTGPGRILTPGKPLYFDVKATSASLKIRQLNVLYGTRQLVLVPIAGMSIPVLVPEG